MIRRFKISLQSYSKESGLVHKRKLQHLAMTFKITGIPQSVCTLRVLEVLAEKGVTDFELYKPNMAAKEHKVSVHEPSWPLATGSSLARLTS